VIDSPQSGRPICDFYLIGQAFGTDGNGLQVLCPNTTDALFFFYFTGLLEIVGYGNGHGNVEVSERYLAFGNPLAGESGLGRRKETDYQAEGNKRSQYTTPVVSLQTHK